MRRGILLLLLPLLGSDAGPAWAQERVDLELVLLPDASGSIDPAEVQFQRRGWAGAVTSPEVLAAIQAALAEPRTLKVVFGYARQRTFILRKAGVGVDLDQDDLVNQVIVDTVRGRLTWNPNAVALSTHLCGAIRARTSKLLTRRKPAAPEEEPCAASFSPARPIRATVWPPGGDALITRSAT